MWRRKHFSGLSGSYRNATMTANRSRHGQMRHSSYLEADPCGSGTSTKRRSTISGDSVMSRSGGRYVDVGRG